MKVRIKLSAGQPLKPRRNVDGKLALAISSLLTPAAVLSITIALWRLLSDFNLTEEFAIRRGLLSHWQVWLALGILIQSLSVYLDRYGRRVEGES